MKRNFLKIGLFSLMLASVPMVFTGCKDYDGDINTLTEKDNNLQTQLSALQSALDKCNSDVAAAKQAAQQYADNAADNAQKLAQAYADQAAAQAKADAIAACIAQVEEMMKGVPSAADIQGLASQIAGIDTSLNTLSTEIDGVKSSITSLQVQMAAVEKYKELIDQNSGQISSINSQISSLNQTLSNLQTAIEEIRNSNPASEDDLKSINETLDSLAKEVAAISANLVTLQTGTLRSMVFYPELFVDGVEAVEYPYLPYMALPAVSGAGNFVYNTLTDVKCVVPAATTDSKTQVVWNYNWNNPTFITDYNPIINVTYELNPSTAIVKEDQLVFTNVRDIEMVSRGIDAVETSHVMKIAPNSMSIQNGNLTVGFTTMGKALVSREENDPNYAGNEGSIFALQANLGKDDQNQDVVVTSDYAMLYPTTLSLEAIGYTAKAAPMNFAQCPYPQSVDKILYKTMEQALYNKASFEVEYSNDCLNIAELVNTHYIRTTLSKKAGHHIWAYGEESAYGLHYDYALVQYYAGENKTSDSRYGKLDGSIFYPRTVDAQGNTLDQTGIASVGREPVVRVRVLSEANNVLLVGFIKIKIVKNKETLVTAPFSNTVSFKACNEVETALTWSEISSEVLDKVALTSKTEFDALYKLDVDEAGYAKQFASPTREAQPLQNSGTVYGVIEEIIDPVPGVGTVTNVLTWTIPNNCYTYQNGAQTVKVYCQQGIFEKQNNSQQVYVRYVSKVGDVDDTARPMIYIPWTIKISKPLTGGSISTKSQAWWFNNSQDVYMNVPYPKDGGTPFPFTRNQNDNWLNQRPVFSAVSGYPASNAYKFYFASKQASGFTPGTASNQAIYYAVCDHCGNVGSKSNPVTDSDMLKHLFKYDQGVFNNNCLYYNGVLVATLDQESGVITYQTSEAAKQILNSNGAKSREEADMLQSNFKANVGMVTSTTCNMVIPMNNSMYDNYFIRPITVEVVDSGNMTDAVANGSWVRIADLIDFTDWRNEAFKGNNFKNSWLFAYYDVKSITVDLSGAQAKSNNQTNSFKAMFPQGQLLVCNSKNITDIAAGNKVTFDFSSYNSEAQGSKTAYEAMANQMGYFVFQNTNGIMHKTEISNIKITIEYAWGKYVVPQTITLTADPTLGN